MDDNDDSNLMLEAQLSRIKERPPNACRMFQPINWRETDRERESESEQERINRPEE